MIQKMLVLLKNYLNYLKDSIFECFFKEYNRLLVFFSQHIIIESLSLQEEIIIKDIRNVSRLKKELNYTAIKDTRNLFRIGKEAKGFKDRKLKILRIFLSMKKKIVINQ